jgi:hypothetical protein
VVASYLATTIAMALSKVSTTHRSLPAKRAAWRCVVVYVIRVRLLCM